MDSNSADDPAPIKGDVIPTSIRRVRGEPGSTDGLIEMGLVGHPYLYRVRIETGGGAPRLIELQIVGDQSAEIEPLTIRQIPVRRLASAAARFISNWDGALSPVDEIYDPTVAVRPERPPNGGRRKLDDVHYRQVATLLLTARECGFAPREYVRDRLGPASVPTVDRWIKEAKRRGFLRRDWSTTDEH